MPPWFRLGSTTVSNGSGPGRLPNLRCGRCESPIQIVPASTWSRFATNCAKPRNGKTPIRSSGSCAFLPAASILPSGQPHRECAASPAAAARQRRGQGGRTYPGSSPVAFTRFIRSFLKQGIQNPGARAQGLPRCLEVRSGAAANDHASPFQPRKFCFIFQDGRPASCLGARRYRDDAGTGRPVLREQVRFSRLDQAKTGAHPILQCRGGCSFHGISPERNMAGLAVSHSPLLPYLAQRYLANSRHSRRRVPVTGAASEPSLCRGSATAARRGCGSQPVGAASRTSGFLFRRWFRVRCPPVISPGGGGARGAFLTRAGRPR